MAKSIKKHKYVFKVEFEPSVIEIMAESDKMAESLINTWVISTAITKNIELKDDSL